MKTRQEAPSAVAGGGLLIVCCPTVICVVLCWPALPCRDVIRSIRKLNAERGYSVAVMMDTEGSEIHMGDLSGNAPSCKADVSQVKIVSLRLATGVRTASSSIRASYCTHVVHGRVNEESILWGITGARTKL